MNSRKNRKDKPVRKFNIKDLQAIDAVQQEEKQKAEDLRQEFYSDELNEKLINYNEKITELDEMYTSLKPHSQVIVRVYVRPMQKTENGVLITNKAQIKMPTNSGYGAVGFVDNPFPYEPKAIVVAVPKGVETVKVGEIIGLGNNPIKAVPFGSGQDIIIQIPNGFIHPDERYKYMEHVVGNPENPEDRNYGYLAISPYDIQVTL